MSTTSYETPRITTILCRATGCHSPASALVKMPGTTKVCCLECAHRAKTIGAGFGVDVHIEQLTTANVIEAINSRGDA